MKAHRSIILLTSIIMLSCGTEPILESKVDESKHDTTVVANITIDSTATEPTTPLRTNDTLNELANFIGGNSGYNYTYFKSFTAKPGFAAFTSNFEKRWNSFDSSKLTPIKNFVQNEFRSKVNSKNIFYPFSGPDILYSSTLFPDAERFTMIGLEPVGTLPIIDDKKIIADSIQNYFNKINSSLNAILKFSFFRTISMKEDLSNEEVDGTLHLILLFLNRTGHSIVNIKPFYIDSTGNSVYVDNTNTLKQKGYKNPSIEITTTINGKTRTVTYTSTDLSDMGLRKNKGLLTYLANLHFETTYLKGASYLMHKKSFTTIRDLILDHGATIVQDDSGIAIQYITNHSSKWNFDFYGMYTKPINMFTQHYQADLDSLYKLKGAKKLGFGLGYNYRDKNSNFMIIKKQNS